MTSWLPYDPDLVQSIASAMDLRRPNAEALDELAKQVANGDGREVIADLATGVGKTYLAAALVDYLAQSGVRNVLVVTPGSTILNKTIRNFTPGDSKFVNGAEVSPLLVTRDNFARGEIGDALHNPAKLKLFIFTVQTLTSPTTNANRKAYEENEVIGEALYSYLQSADDLIVIVDEHHVIREKAAKFNAAVHDLGARAVVGLTATPDSADVIAGKVVYQYPLAAAIADRLVKVPVIVYRQDGRKDLATQLADACLLRAHKEAVWAQYAEAAEVPPVTPVLFAVCQSKQDAVEVAGELAQDGLLPGAGEVLVVTSDSTDAALEALSRVEDADSPVKAIVSVDMLKEGWDVGNIAVIVARRRLASETLTEQILGRGLRLPYGRRTDVAAIDQLDVVAHESYAELLKNKDALLQRLVSDASATATGAPVASTELDFSGLNAPDPEQPDAGFAVTTTASTDPGLDGLGDAELLLAQDMGAQQKQIEADLQAVGTPMPQNTFVLSEGAVPEKVTISFPLALPVVQPAKFSLTSLNLVTVEQQGSLFKNDPKIKLVRHAIDAQRDINGDLHVIDQLVTSAEASRVVVSATAINSSLLGRIINSGVVEPDLTEQLLAADIVAAFLKGAGIDGSDDWEWSVDHAERAEDALFKLIGAAHKGRQTTSSFKWDPVRLPIARPAPTDPRAVWDSFVKGAFVGPWNKSVDKYASFDSDSAELALARKLDTWDDVAYWQRLYSPGPAWIAWKGGRYHPDFVVVDKDGAHWVIEAKADKAAVDSAEVASKSEAAEAWIDRVNSSKSFGTWRYKLATEMKIAAAVGWRSITG